MTTIRLLPEEPLKTTQAIIIAMSRRLIGFAAVLVAVLALLILTPAGTMLRGFLADPGQRTAAHHQDSQADSPGAMGSPSKIERPPRHPRPTVEETKALLESTIIPGADLDELTLVQWTSTLNKLIENTGVDRRDLRVILSHRVARHPLGSQCRWSRRNFRNASVSSMLQYMTRGKSPLGYRIGEGRVELGLRRGPEDESQSEAKVRAKLDQITIPVIDFDDTTVLEARDFLISRCLESDHHTLDPARKGIWIVLLEPHTHEKNPGTTPDPDAEGDSEEDVPIFERTLTLQSRDITAAEALDQITRSTGLQWKIDDFAVVISPVDPGTPPESHPPPVPPEYENSPTDRPDDQAPLPPLLPLLPPE